MAHRPLKPAYSAALRRRKLLRFMAMSAVALPALAVILDHLGCFGYRGDDWSRFDGKLFKVSRITPEGLIEVAAGRPPTLVRLLGVTYPDESTTAEFHDHLTPLLTERTIILKLEPVESRDPAGHLLAYVYLNESECLNVEVVRQGLARADRTREHTLRAPIDGAETDARKHHRGLWKDVRDSRMP
jgi:hypothetical protein